jgi:hypothetical protein
MTSPMLALHVSRSGRLLAALSAVLFESQWLCDVLYQKLCCSLQPPCQVLNISIIEALMLLWCTCHYGVAAQAITYDTVYTSTTVMLETRALRRLWPAEPNLDKPQV